MRISTTTSTGQKLAAQRFGAENVFYFPLDFAFSLRPYLDVLRPELVVVAAFVTVKHSSAGAASLDVS